jgi:hypothetical protein
MKFADKRKPAAVPISEIVIGDTFLYNDKLHMKTCGGSRSNSYKHDWPNSVVCLQTGRENGLRDDVKVIPVDVTAEYR